VSGTVKASTLNTLRHLARGPRAVTAWPVSERRRVGERLRVFVRQGYATSEDRGERNGVGQPIPTYAITDNGRRALLREQAAIDERLAADLAGRPASTRPRAEAHVGEWTEAMLAEVERRGRASLRDIAGHDKDARRLVSRKLRAMSEGALVEAVGKDTSEQGRGAIVYAVTSRGREVLARRAAVHWADANLHDSRFDGDEL
jgi:DNA-binding PadR family transcriptional regulator